jgi:hypothetical protein
MNADPEKTSRPVAAVAMGTLCVVGIVGNAIQLMFLKQRLPKYTNCLVRQLYLSDFVLLAIYTLVAVPAVYSGTFLFEQKILYVVQEALVFETCLLTLLLSVSQCVTVTNADCFIGRTLSSVVGALTAVVVSWVLTAVVVVLTWQSGCSNDFSPQRPHFRIGCSQGLLTDQAVFQLFLYVQLIAPLLLSLVHAGIIVSTIVKPSMPTTWRTHSSANGTAYKPNLLISSFVALVVCFAWTCTYWAFSQYTNVNISLFITFICILNSSVKPYLFNIRNRSDSGTSHSACHYNQISRVPEPLGKNQCATFSSQDGNLNHMCSTET